MTVEKHVAENVRLIASIDRLDNIFLGDFPGDPDALATARWELTRDLLLYFATQESLVVQPLAADLRPNAVLASAQAADRLRHLQAMFAEQADTRFARPEATQWRAAGRQTRANLAQVRAALVQDQAKLFPFLPAQPRASVRPGSKSNFASQAWSFRQQLFPNRS